MILEYMKKEYRPYGVTDLILNLHNKVNKTMMTKLLDDMVEEQKLIVKRYGKLSFYCYSELKCDENIKPIDFETLRALKQELGEYENDSAEHKKSKSNWVSTLNYYVDPWILTKIDQLQGLHNWKTS